MHGYPPHAFSLPMMRIQGTIAAYLETGDPYLMQTGEALVENAFRLHRNSWPRMATGRDGAFVRSTILMWRYFANAHFRDKVREAVYDIMATQRSDGSFGDQGGGSGIHSRGAYITKPWMCIYAINGVLDYLELVDPDEPRMNEAVQALADWMLRERWDRGDGIRALSYQHPTLGNPRHYNGMEWIDLPSDAPWHHEAMARLLAWASLRKNDAEYLNAWAESHQRVRGPGMDQSAAGAFQFLTWLQARLWNARLDENARCIHVDATSFGELMPRSAELLTPDGPIAVHWTGPGQIAIDENVQHAGAADNVSQSAG